MLAVASTYQILTDVFVLFAGGRPLHRMGCRPLPLPSHCGEGLRTETGGVRTLPEGRPNSRSVLHCSPPFFLFFFYWRCGRTKDRETMGKTDRKTTLSSFFQHAKGFLFLSVSFCKLVGAEQPRSPTTSATRSLRLWRRFSSTKVTLSSSKETKETPFIF